MNSDRSSVKLHFQVLAPKDSGLLSRITEATLDEVESGKPISIQLARGVMATGKVVSSDGLPLSSIHVRSNAGLTSTDTDRNGDYEMCLAKGTNVLSFTGDDESLRLPTDGDDFFRRFPSVFTRVDLSDGMPRRLEPFVVAKAMELEIVTSTPDGKAAAGAELVILDGGPTPDPKRVTNVIENNGRIMRLSVKEISRRTKTDLSGRAKISPRGVPSDEATVDVKLATDQGAFVGTAKLAGARDGKLPIRLEQAWLLKGRVLLDRKPIDGATVTIQESQTTPRRGSNGIVLAERLFDEQSTKTDADGWYRVAVQTNGYHRVTIKGLPGDESRAWASNVATRISDRVLQVKDFCLVDRDGREETPKR